MLLHKTAVCCCLEYSVQVWSKNWFSKTGKCKRRATGILKGLRWLLGEDLLSLLSSAVTNACHLAQKEPKGRNYRSVMWKSGQGSLSIASPTARSTRGCMKLVEGFHLNTGGWQTRGAHCCRCQNFSLPCVLRDTGHACRGEITDSY